MVSWCNTNFRPAAIQAFHSLWNKKSRRSYLHNISHSLRSFWSYVRFSRKKQSPIPTLESLNQTHSSDLAKASLINKILTVLFTTNFSSCHSSPTTSSQVVSEDLLCLPDKVIELIQSLPNKTSRGQTVSPPLYKRQLPSFNKKQMFFLAHESIQLLSQSPSLLLHLVTPNYWPIFPSLSGFKTTWKTCSQHLTWPLNFWI